MEDLTQEAYDFILADRAQEEAERQATETARRAAHAEYIEQLQMAQSEIQQC